VIRGEFTPSPSFAEMMSKSIPGDVLSTVRVSPVAAGKELQQQKMIVARYAVTENLKKSADEGWRVVTSGLASRLDDFIWDGQWIGGGNSTCDHPKRKGYCTMSIPPLSNRFSSIMHSEFAEKERVALAKLSKLVINQIAAMHNQWKTSDKLVIEVETGQSRETFRKVEGTYRMLKALTVLSLNSELRGEAGLVFDPKLGLVDASYILSRVAKEGKTLKQLNAEIDKRAAFAREHYRKLNSSEVLATTRTAIGDLVGQLSRYDYMSSSVQ